MPYDAGGDAPSADVFALDGCIAWLHRPPAGAALDHGVVLCNPLGAACVATHRNWREFAMLLARAGFPVLRFDYPGTGDSAEPPEGLLAAWRASIGSAVDWLKRHAGVTQVSLCGLRFGALLAAQAAAANPGAVAGLVLLVPPANGRSYLRELEIGAVTRNLPAGSGGVLEVDGLCLSAEALAELRRLDLPDAVRAARPAQILVLQPAWQAGAASALARAASDIGAALSQRGFPGFRDFMKPAYKSLLPEAAFRDVIAWLARLPAAPAADVRPPAAPARLVLGDGVEEAFGFGADAGLFAIACLPRHPIPGLPAALIVNTGAEPHTGHSRFAVLLARRLAALGMASFRIDVTGLGDSGRAALPILPPGQHAADYSEDQLAHLRCFHPEFVDDAAAASAEIARRGFASHLVIGLCSGANLALHAAQRDKSVAGVVLINANLSVRGDIPPRDDKKSGMAGRHPARVAVRFCLSTLGLTAPHRNRLRAGWRLLRHDAACWLAQHCGSPAVLDEKSRWFWTLRRRGISLLAVSSAGDEALAGWRLHAARLWPRTDGAAPGMPLIIGNSHSFEPIAMRDGLIDAICAHVQRTHLRPLPVPMPAPMPGQAAARAAPRNARRPQPVQCP